MVDKEMLTAMSEMMDQKLNERFEQFEEKLDRKLDKRFGQFEEKLDRKLDKRFEQFEEKLDQKFDEKLDQKFDEKLNPIYGRLDRLESDMRYVRVVQLENKVIPRLSTIEQCYLDTSKRFMERTERIDAMSADIAVLKSVVSDHSQRLNKIPV